MKCIASEEHNGQAITRDFFFNRGIILMSLQEDCQKYQKFLQCMIQTREKLDKGQKANLEWAYNAEDKKCYVFARTF